MNEAPRTELPKRYASFALAAAAFCFITSFSACYFGVPMALAGRADFRMLYSAGYMVRTHQGAAIYRYDDQMHYQNALVSPENVALPFDHPAYEALALAPLSFLSYRAAYIVFFLINFALLALGASLIRRRARMLTETWNWLPFAVIAGFLPIAIALIQGQDSIVLLVLLSAAALFMDGSKEPVQGTSASSGLKLPLGQTNGRTLATAPWNEVAAGVCVGLALFKLQFAIPIAFLFLVWRKWKLLAGFAVTAAVVAAISALVTGPSGVVDYVRLLLSIGPGFSNADQLRLGIYPMQMANLRGLFSAMFYFSPAVAWVATLAASALVLFQASRKQASLSLAVLAAALISYHGLIHDMSLLVIPSSAMLENGLRVRSRSTIALAITLLTLPTALFLARVPYFVLAILLIGSLWAIAGLQSQQAGAFEVAAGRGEIT